MTLTTEGCSVDSVDREDGRVEMLEVQGKFNNVCKSRHQQLDQAHSVTHRTNSIKYFFQLLERVPPCFDVLNYKSVFGIEMTNPSKSVVYISLSSYQHFRGSRQFKLNTFFPCLFFRERQVKR